MNAPQAKKFSDLAFQTAHGCSISQSPPNKYTPRPPPPPKIQNFQILTPPNPGGVRTM